MTNYPSLEAIRELPKVALHDHLDGGLRPETVIEHCRANGHELPTTDPAELRRWFFDAANSGSLVRYLETFAHTVAAMQSPDQLSKVAREFVLDQAADGVVYAEARWAPEQHLAQGLTMAEAVAAVSEGLHDGMREAHEQGDPIVARQILTAMRHVEPTQDVAQLLTELDDDTLCGFDIAGAEAGFLPARFLPSFEQVRRANGNITIHAGEAAGVESVWEALQVCGTHRLGHGVRIIEDIDFLGDEPRLGPVAHAVRDHQIPLEVAPTSNLQTGIAPTLREHPIGVLYRLGFAVTVNCDNRLVSDTTLSQEYYRLCQELGWGIDDIHRTTITAMRAAFWHHDQRERMIRDVIEPGYRR